MPRYSEERKTAVLRKMLPPNSQSAPHFAKEEGISELTLYNWRNQAKQRGKLVSGSGKQTEEWSPQAKFSAVVETASMNEHTFSEYCRKKGLYPDQIKRWKEDFLEGLASAGKSRQQITRVCYGRPRITESRTIDVISPIQSEKTGLRFIAFLMMGVAVMVWFVCSLYLSGLA
ncbi:MAG: transposase [Endozoicomonadaceae bacterium]|nr:transposase [Endozoicomonadaceae bacterium]